jgi:hypothetical protein
MAKYSKRYSNTRVTRNRDLYINNTDMIRKNKIEEYLIWFVGDGDELLNYFTKSRIMEQAEEPIYNRNKRDYFWTVVSEEEGVKRSHSGIPRAIVETIVNAIGSPNISAENPELDSRITDIVNENDLLTILNQEQTPMTLVTGHGAFKISVDPELSNKPIITYYDARNVKFETKTRRIVKVKFYDYFTENNKAYCLVDCRYRENGNSIITYKLYELPYKDAPEFEYEDNEVSLESIEQTKDLKDIQFTGINEMLAVPCVFFKDQIHEEYGRSIFTGKVDLFDDLDQALSQSANAVRKSTPVEYYPMDLIETKQSGERKPPERYDRTYINFPSGRSGEGDITSQIQTTQPSINFAQYDQESVSILNMILTGVLSPATMGIDLAKKDNADAQREKEKVTIMTRNNIILKQKRIVSKLIELTLLVEDYINNPQITEFQNYSDISVDFDEFANPSFENQLSVLGSALQAGNISVDRFIELLWGDALSEQEKQKEKEYVEAFMNKGMTDPFGQPLQGEGPVSPDLAASLGLGGATEQQPEQEPDETVPTAPIE